MPGPARWRGRRAPAPTPVVVRQVHQRQMPVVVHRERVVLLPGAVSVVSQRMPSCHPALHLVHVRHRMHGPGVVRLEFQRPPAQRLGARVLVALLEAEGVHAQHVAIAGIVRVPLASARPMRSRNMAVWPEHQVHHVGELQRERSRGWSTRWRSSRRLARPHVAFGPALQGGLEGLLAHRRPAAARGRSGQARARRWQQLPVDGAEHEAGHHQVAGDEVRVLRQRRLQHRDRIEPQAVEEVERLLVGGRPGRSGRWKAPRRRASWCGHGGFLE